jgi:hypothetical protein
MCFSDSAVSTELRRSYLDNTYHQQGATQMTTDDAHQSSERSTRMSHPFGMLGKLHLLFLGALVLFPHLLSAQWWWKTSTYPGPRDGTPFSPTHTRTAAQNLTLPEESHLSRACATVFTDAYTRALAQRTLLLHLRPDAPPALSTHDCVHPQ